MPYSPTTWVEGVTTLGPTNMNKIEAALASLSAPAPSTTPPASPADGDIWYLPADPTNGAIWQFRYNASGGTYKWEFVGGSPLAITPANYTPGSTGAYLTDTAPGSTITIPRTGFYYCETKADLAPPSSTSAQYLGFSSGDRSGQQAVPGGEASIYHGSPTQLNSGTVVQNVVYCTTAVSVYTLRRIAVTPVRVG